VASVTTLKEDPNPTESDSMRHAVVLVFLAINCFSRIKVNIFSFQKSNQPLKGRGEDVVGARPEN
jgi:hypothetical protein